MTAKCANPACSTPFHYFRTGKIYLIDMTVPHGAFGPRNGSRDVEYFWLCGDCSGSMQVTVNGLGAVVVEAVAASTPTLPAKLGIVNIADQASDAKVLLRSA